MLSPSSGQITTRCYFSQSMPLGPWLSYSEMLYRPYNSLSHYEVIVFLNILVLKITRSHDILRTTWWWFLSCSRIGMWIFLEWYENKWEISGNRPRTYWSIWGEIINQWNLRHKNNKTNNALRLTDMLTVCITFQTNSSKSVSYVTL
jgi:hypothetical protein